MNRSKLLKSFAMLGVAAALSLTAVSAEATVLKSSQSSFYVSLDGDGSRKTIATYGTLTFFAQCLVNRNGFDRVRIFATNSKGGWYDSERGDLLRAGQRALLLSEEEETGDSDYDDGSRSVATRTGLFVDIEASLGLNIFGHDCVAMGTVTKMTGN